MGLKKELMEERVIALKNKNTVRKGAITSVLAAITQFEKDSQKELKNGVISDDQVLKIIEKGIKQRKDSIKQFKDAGRIDLVDQETKEMNVLEEFMPEQFSEDEVRKIVKEAIESLGATSMKQMGQVIGAIRPKLQGKADMGFVSGVVKSHLS